MHANKQVCVFTSKFNHTDLILRLSFSFKRSNELRDSKDVKHSSKLILIEEALVHRAPVAQLVEYRASMREVVSSTPAVLTLRVLK